MRKSVRGFTVVELLIVIVVIGILAAITLIAYNGVQQRAINAARLTEVEAWQKQLLLYYASTGAGVNVTAGYYCLGTGFPNGACRNYQQSGSNTYYQANNTALMTALQSVAGAPPTASHTPVNNAYVGPFVSIWANRTGFSIFTFFTGNSSGCPSSMYYVWDDGAGSLMCGIDASYS